jgi:LTXXQ motif family protein
MGLRPLRRSVKIWGDFYMRILNKSTLVLACLCGAMAFSQANAQPRPPAPDREEMGSPQEMWLDEMCSERNGHQGRAEDMRDHVEHLATMLELNPSQVAALKDIEDARMKDAGDFRASTCAHKPDLSTFTGRINFRVAMMQHRLDAFKDEAGKLNVFYNSLDAKQKAAFEEMGAEEDMHHEHMNGPDE